MTYSPVGYDEILKIESGGVGVSVYRQDGKVEINIGCGGDNITLTFKEYENLHNMIYLINNKLS